MPDDDQAGDLKRLMDRGGTGKVIELSRESSGQPFSGEYYLSAREDITVISVQAESVGRTRAALRLAELARDVMH